MSSAKATPEQDAISREIEIAAPPERVFQALTDPKQLFAWWGKEPSVELSVFEMEARTGGRWRFRCKPVAGAEHGAVGEQLRRNREQEFEAHGEVLEYDPRACWSGAGLRTGMSTPSKEPWCAGSCRRPPAGPGCA